MKEVLDLLDTLNSRFKTLESKFDTLDSKVGALDSKVGALDSRVTTRLDKIDTRLDRVETLAQKQGVLLESVSSDLKQTMEGVIGNREVMDTQFAGLRKQIDERVQPIEWASRHVSKELATRRRAAKPRRS